MELRPEEAFAQQAFTSFLGQVTSAPGQDPPDLMFTVGGNRWAVEVTTFHMYVERNGGEASQAAFHAQVGLMRERLSQLVPADKGYILCVGVWLSNANLRKLEEWARQYIEASGTSELNFNGMDEIWIQADVPADDDKPTGKVGTVAGILGLSTVPDEKQSLTADIQAVVDYGAKRIIEDKGPKLAKLTGYDKAVLLIVNDRGDGYPFLEPTNLSTALAKAGIPALLKNGVYLVDGDGSVNLVG